MANSKLCYDLPPLLSRITSPRAFDIWQGYARIIKHQLGLDEVVCDHLGHLGASVGVAEYLANGPSYYQTSVVAPIRNAWYGATSIERRWAALQQRSLIPPILDYGCGVGFTLVWMAECGYSPSHLYGWDVPGAQRRVAQAAFDRDGVQWWDERSPSTFGTIICLNVLEHVPSPLDTLGYLHSMTTNLIANCDTDADGDHVAPVEERIEMRRLLLERGQLIDPPAEPTT